MTNPLTVRTHDDLIAYVPHAMGFVPDSSMLCLGFGGAPTSRLDLPESPEEMTQFLEQLAEVYLRRHPSRRVALLAFGADGPACVEALSALGERLYDGGRGPDVGPILWVNGEEWFDLLDGTSGTVDPGARTRMDAEFALMGRVMPAGRREDLAAALQGDPGPVGRHLDAAVGRAAAMDTEDRTDEAQWLGSRLDDFLETRSPLSDVDAARVLAAVGDGGARDAVQFRMSRSNAPVFSELWHDLVRRAPGQVRDTAAAMLALSSYLDGKGAQAWVALDQITAPPGAKPPLADLVAIALEHAVDPREWERAMRQSPPPEPAGPAGPGAPAAPGAPGVLMQQAALRETPTADHRPGSGPDEPNATAAPNAGRHDPQTYGSDPDTRAPSR